MSGSRFAPPTRCTGSTSRARCTTVAEHVVVAEVGKIVRACAEVVALDLVRGSLVSRDGRVDVLRARRAVSRRRAPDRRRASSRRPWSAGPPVGDVQVVVRADAPRRPQEQADDAEVAAMVGRQRGSRARATAAGAPAAAPACRGRGRRRGTTRRRRGRWHAGVRADDLVDPGADVELAAELADPVARARRSASGSRPRASP